MWLGVENSLLIQVSIGAYQRSNGRQQTGLDMRYDKAARSPEEWLDKLDAWATRLAIQSPDYGLKYGRRLSQFHHGIRESGYRVVDRAPPVTLMSVLIPTGQRKPPAHWPHGLLPSECGAMLPANRKIVRRALNRLPVKAWLRFSLLPQA